VKSVVFGARRSAQAGRDRQDPLDAALAPAFSEGRWRVPSRFNFTRDVVEVLAKDSKRQALTFVGRDGIIEPRSFLQFAHGAARWASYLREHGVAPGDRVLVVVGASPEWLEIVLACIKIGAVTVPCSEALPSAALEIRMATVGAKVVVAGERTAAIEPEPLTGRVTVLRVDEARRNAHRLPTEGATTDTSGGDPALVVWTTGRTNGPRGAAHTHQAIFAARLHAQHWLDAKPGDVVWCSAPSDSAQAFWSSVFGPWSCGAEIVLSEEPLEPVEEIDLVRRLRVTTLCRTPAEYQALLETRRLTRCRSEQLRRLVATGDRLSEDLIGVVEEETGLVIHDGYGQAETGVIVAHGVGASSPRGSIGLPLPGYDIAVIDAGGHQLPPGHPGDIALRGTPPSLFAGYWNAPTSTKTAFRGEWYVTGDIGMTDDLGFFWLEGRAGDTSVEEVNVDVRRASLPITLEPARETPASPIERAPVRPTIQAPVVEKPRTESTQRPSNGRVAAATVAPAMSNVVPPVPQPKAERLHTPLWARLTGAIWLILLGVLIGGAAIPHASDEPRVAPASSDPPNAICLLPTSRK
jgi:acyl-coenzyme A synthetase/AMP-(fatty) acid ligase